MCTSQAERRGVSDFWSSKSQSAAVSAEPTFLKLVGNDGVASGSSQCSMSMESMECNVEIRAERGTNASDSVQHPYQGLGAYPGPWPMWETGCIVLCVLCMRILCYGSRTFDST